MSQNITPPSGAKISITNQQESHMRGQRVMNCALGSKKVVFTGKHLGRSI